MEQRPQLIAKWKTQTVGGPNPVQNRNPNPNPNVQTIVVEPREPIIIVVTRGVVATGANQNILQEQSQAQLRVQRMA